MRINIRTSRIGAGVAVLSLALFAATGITAGQSGKLSRAEVKKLATAHNTPADHLKLARHYQAVAAEHEVEAKEHEELAAAYSRNPSGTAQKHPMSGQTAEHCRFYAEHCRNLAKEARALATSHEAMAKDAAH